MKEDHKVELHKYREKLVRQKENWSKKTDLSGSWRKKKSSKTISRRARKNTTMGRPWETWRCKREEQSKLSGENEIVKYD